MLKNKKIYIVTVLFFLIVILIGANILRLPICSNIHLTEVNAIFEATSSLTGTGTTILNVSEDLTFWGQLIIITLVQIGAVGFMSLFYFVFKLVTRSKKLSDTMVIASETSVDNYNLAKKTLGRIIKYTFLIEFIGAWLLSFKFIPIYGLKTGIWYSIFHSISAFCNAGFDLFGTTSFTQFNGDIYLYVVLIILMFFGSVGFFVLEDLVHWFASGKKNKITIQSKIILITTFSIIIIPTILLKIYNPELKMMDCVFMVVSSRNTGFATININNLKEINLLIIIMLMFIGGGPISNSAGIRVNVLAIILLTMISNLKNQDEIVVFYKRINEKLIKKSVTIITVNILIVLVGSMLFALTENLKILDVLFYIVSSFSTTGLSTIDSTQISVIGKIIASIMMYLGRIAPITFISLFITNNKKTSEIKYPEIGIIL